MKVCAGKQSLATVTQTNEFKDFKTKLYFLFGAIIDSHGQLIAYPWEIFFCTNMTESEVDVLALASIRHSLQTGIAKVELTSPETQAGQSGKVKISFNDGMRVVPAIANLMHVLHRNGIDLFGFCKASMKVSVFGPQVKKTLKTGSTEARLPRPDTP